MIYLNIEVLKCNHYLVQVKTYPSSIKNLIDRFSWKMTWNIEKDKIDSIYFIVKQLNPNCLKCHDVWNKALFLSF